MVGTAGLGGLVGLSNCGPMGLLVDLVGELVAYSDETKRSPKCSAKIPAYILGVE
jgi:hypothetical protein